MVDMYWPIRPNRPNLPFYGVLFDSQQRIHDFYLIVNGIKFHCHRHILCASSNVFEKMIYRMSSRGMASTNIIELEEPRNSELYFQDFVEYLYYGNIEMSMESVMLIFLFANKYKVHGLVDKCLAYLSRNMALAGRTGRLVPWMMCTDRLGHRATAQMFLNFASSNLHILMNTPQQAWLDVNFMCSLLEQHNLVVPNENILCRYVCQWLDVQQKQIRPPEKMIEIMTRVLNPIRFEHMTYQQLKRVTEEFETSKKYREVFMEIAERGRMLYWSAMENPRFYTDNSKMVTLGNIHALPMCYVSTTTFTLHDPGPKGVTSCEWAVNIHPKGVWIQKCVLLDRNVEVPEHMLRIIRISILCQNPEEKDVKIGVLVYGSEDGVECVRSVTQRTHRFSERDKLLIMDDLIPFTALNPLPDSDTSLYLTGPNRDILKIEITVEPVFKPVGFFSS